MTLLWEDIENTKKIRRMKDEMLKPSTRSLLAMYVELRSECAGLEQLIATGAFTVNEANRLDKGVTVMKVGFKLVKQILRKRGVQGCLNPDVILTRTPADQQGDRHV